MKFLRLGSMLLILLFFSCGKDGKDGKDGNANVQTYVLNISPETEFDVSVSLPLPELTQDVIDDDLVETYVKFFDNPTVYAVSRGAFASPIHLEPYSISVGMGPGNIFLFFRDADGNDFSMYSDQLEFVKVVIAESASTTTRTVVGNL